MSNATTGRIAMPRLERAITRLSAGLALRRCGDRLRLVSIDPPEANDHPDEPRRSDS